MKKKKKLNEIKTKRDFFTAGSIMMMTLLKQTTLENGYNVHPVTDMSNNKHNLSL